MSNHELIDSHQHLWVMSERAYDWIEPSYGVIYDDFTPGKIATRDRAIWRHRQCSRAGSRYI